MNVFNNSLELIGNTPLIELSNIEKEFNLNCKLFAKAEMFNVTGSIKVRVAYYMVNKAIEEGILKPGGTVIEPTSGNTGVGLSYVCQMMGFKFIAVMPDTMSKERIMLIKAYGGDVILTPGAEGMKGSLLKADELNKEIPNSIIASQFDNKYNPLAHYNSTAKEIYNALDGNIDIFVAAIGTGGTITGCAKYLKEQKDVKVYGVEPASSPLITKGVAGSHKIQGIGANFIPSILDQNLIDEVITCTDEDAYEYSRLLAVKEGLFVGISSGAALKAAIEIAKKNNNKNIVLILPDTGERYLSSGLVK